MRSATRLIVLAVAVAAMSSASAQQPTTAPVGQMPDPLLLGELQTGMARLVPQLTAAAQQPDQRTLAMAHLEAMQMAFLTPLLAHAGDRDLEVQARVCDLMDDLLSQTSYARYVAASSAAGRTKLLQLRKQSAAWVGSLISPDTAVRAAAIERLTQKTDPKCLAEPLLAAALASGDDEVVAAAAKVAADGRYKSEDMVNPLLEALTHKWSPAATEALPAVVNERSGTILVSRQPPRQTEANANIIAALTEMRSRSATAVLLACMPNDKTPDRYGRITNLAGYAGNGDIAAMADVIVASRDLRAMPVFLALAARPASTSMTVSTGATTINCHANDVFLYAAIKLSGGELASYGMISGDPRTGILFGFPNANDRAEALDRLRKWWEQNRSRDSNEKPLDFDLILKGRAAVLAAANSARTPATSPSAGAMPNNLGGLNNRIAETCEQLIGAFGSPRMAHRQVAQTTFAGLYQGYLDALSAAGPDGRADLQIVDAAASQVSLHQFIARLDKKSRDHLVALRRTDRALVDGLFSSDQRTIVASGKRLASLRDPDGAAEPLVLRCLHSSSPEVVLSAAEAANTGQYRSDAVVDALLDVLAAEPMPAAYAASALRVTPYPTVTPWGMAVSALDKVRTPRVGAAYLALMLQQDPSINWVSCASLGEGVLAYGDKRLIPLMIEQVRNPSTAQLRGVSIATGAAPFIWSQRDVLLSLIIRMTGQDTADYGMMSRKLYGTGTLPVYGFADGVARDVAVKKLLAWWETNSQIEPYRDMVPAALPTIGHGGGIWTKAANNAPTGTMILKGKMVQDW